MGDHLHDREHRRPDADLQHDARLQCLSVPVASGRGNLRHPRDRRHRQPVSLDPRPYGCVRPLGEQRLCRGRGDICGAARRKLRTFRRPPLSGRRSANGRSRTGRRCCGACRASCAVVLLRAIELRADFKSVRMCAITGEASSPAMREDLRRMSPRAWRERAPRYSTVTARPNSAPSPNAGKMATGTIRRRSFSITRLSTPRPGGGFLTASAARWLSRISTGAARC